MFYIFSFCARHRQAQAAPNKHANISRYIGQEALGAMAARHGAVR